MRFLGVLVVVSLVTACTSTTVINSRPQGARLYLNGQYVGATPYTMSDTKIVGSTTTVRLEAQGYETLDGSITRNEQFDAGACIGGVFLLFPFLWIQGYHPMHTFELRPAGGYQPPPPAYVPPQPQPYAPPQPTYPPPQPAPPPPR
jgi:hypothetical protein